MSRSPTHHISKDPPDTAIDISDSDFQGETDFHQPNSSQGASFPRSNPSKNKKYASLREAVKKMPSTSRANSHSKSKRDSIKSRSGLHSNSKSRTSGRGSANRSASDNDDTTDAENTNTDQNEFPSLRDRTLNRPRFTQNPSFRKSAMRSRRQTRLMDEDTDMNQESEINDESEDEHGMTLKDRQEYLNVFHPFGLPLWKPALYKKISLCHSQCSKCAALHPHCCTITFFWECGLVYSFWVVVIGNSSYFLHSFTFGSLGGATNSPSFSRAYPGIFFGPSTNMWKRSTRRPLPLLMKMKNPCLEVLEIHQSMAQVFLPKWYIISFSI
ncbi:hypothetical protein DSO57_1002842 [Entomophthora muscae]|uniref:Uncharacterized protein n=1 Tax=Entomophthora muscae TaxID=34485 RepID=A0ACC2RZT1_9FUNG|nr:hypothetical protein DSO57_1002842 [Entomophthora muscae]